MRSQQTATSYPPVLTTQNVSLFLTIMIMHDRDRDDYDAAVYTFAAAAAAAAVRDQIDIPFAGGICLWVQSVRITYLYLARIVRYA